MANHYNKTQPKWEWGDGWHSKGMTEKQYNYIVTLAAQENLTLTEAVKSLNRGGASGLIDNLKWADGDYRYLRRDWGKYFEEFSN